MKKSMKNTVLLLLLFPVLLWVLFAIIISLANKTIAFPTISHACPYGFYSPKSTGPWSNDRLINGCIKISKDEGKFCEKSTDCNDRSTCYERESLTKMGIKDFYGNVPKYGESRGICLNNDLYCPTTIDENGNIRKETFCPVY